MKSTDDSSDDGEYIVIRNFDQALSLCAQPSCYQLPNKEYWNCVDKTFIDDENKQRYAIDFVVQNSADAIFYYEYVAINDDGSVCANAEELYTSCYEMTIESSPWVKWGPLKQELKKMRK